VKIRAGVALSFPQWAIRRHSAVAGSRGSTSRNAGNVCLPQVSFQVPAGVAGDRQTAVSTAFNFGSGFLPPFMLYVIR
jgi:hypothetical protein